MAEKAKATGTVYGIEFYVDEYWKFQVPSLARGFADYQSMKTAVENAEKSLKSAKRRKTNLSCVSGNLVSVTITGIHAGHGQFITNPKPRKYEHFDKLYADCTFVRELIKQHNAAKKRAEQCNLALNLYAIKGVGRFSQFDHSQHEAAVMAAESSYAAALKRAETADLEQEIANATDDDYDE